MAESKEAVDIDYSKFGPQRPGLRLPSESNLTGPGKLPARSNGVYTGFYPSPSDPYPDLLALRHLFDCLPKFNKDRHPPNVLETLDLSDFDNLNYQGKLFDNDLCSKDLDISLIYWYHRLVNPPQDYLDFLDYLTSKTGVEYPAKGQFVGFKCWDHKDGCRLIIPEISTNRYNPADKFQSIRSSASRTAGSLTNLKWLPSSNENKKAMVNFDLTYPEKVADLLLETSFSDLKPKFWATYKLFLSKLNATFGAYDLANSSNLHLWSSSEPLKPHPHNHSSFIWAKEIGNCLKPLRWFDKGKPVDPDQIKKLWAESIRSNFDVPNLVGSYSEISSDHAWLSRMACNQAVAHISWIPLSPHSFWVKDKANPQSHIRSKVIHRLKYCRRKPLTDLGEYFTDHDFDKSKVNLTFAQTIVEYSNGSRQFGFWTHLKNCVNLQDSDSSPDNRCPVCGSTKVDVYPLDPEIYCPDKLALVGKRGALWLGDPPNPPPDKERLKSNSKRANPPVERLEGTPTELISRLVSE